MLLLAARERLATAELIEHLAVVDDRRLWIGKGYGSLYELCLYGLRFSEGAAYKRIRAARAVQLFPAVGEMLRDGRLSLAALSMLHPHLEQPDAAALIVKACGLRIRRLEVLLSVRCPQDTRREVVRFIGSAPLAKPALVSVPLDALPFNGTSTAASPPPAAGTSDSAVVPVAAAPSAEPPPKRLVRFAFTADEEIYLLLERVRALMRHKYPDGRLEGVLRDALKALLERLDPGIRWAARKSRRRPAAAASARGSGGAPRPGRGA
ncbi:MAG: hypothetical protein ACHQ51_10545 [Elusimicrobiota bacterium]